MALAAASATIDIPLDPLRTLVIDVTTAVQGHVDSSAC
jgi:hypothetical protein